MSTNTNSGAGAGSAQGSAGEAIPYVVIAAAIASILPSAHRLVSINPSENVSWSMEGRRMIFSSHHPRR